MHVINQGGGNQLNVVKEDDCNNGQGNVAE